MGPTCRWDLYLQSLPPAFSPLSLSLRRRPGGSWPARRGQIVVVQYSAPNAEDPRCVSNRDDRPWQNPKRWRRRGRGRGLARYADPVLLLDNETDQPLNRMKRRPDVEKLASIYSFAVQIKVEEYVLHKEKNQNLAIWFAFTHCHTAS